MTEEQLEEIKVKMQILRNEREMQIQAMKLENTKVIDIVYLGKISYKSTEEGKIEEKEIFMCVEEQDGKFIYKYYDENNELMAIENVTDNNILPSKKYLNDDKGIIDEVGKMDKEGITSLSELEEEKEDNNRKIEEEEEQEENKEDETIEIPLEQDITSKLTRKEETDLSQVAKGETLANKLGISSDYTKLVLVSASQVNKYLPQNKRHRNKDAFIAVKPNGESIVLGEDILAFDEHSGTNPTNESLTINGDGSVKEEQSTSRWRIVNGNGREYLSVGWDEKIGKEVKYTQWSPEENKYVDFELETNKTREKNQDVKNLTKEKSGIYNAGKIIERDEKEKDCPEEDVTMVDNNENNDSHTHDVDYAVQKIMEDNIVREASTEIGVKKYVEKMIKNTDMSIEEIIEYIKDDLQRVAKIR